MTTLVEGNPQIVFPLAVTAGEIEDSAPGTARRGDGSPARAESGETGQSEPGPSFGVTRRARDGMIER